MSSTHGRVPADGPSDAERDLMRKRGLTWHKRGGWYRRLPGDAGRTYFGKDSGDALRRLGDEEYRRERGEAEELRPAALTLEQAINLFLVHADHEHAAGAISNVQRARYEDELNKFAAVVGAKVKISEFCQLHAPDRYFRPARAVAVGRGIFAAEKQIVMVRTFFDWCSRIRRFIPPAFLADVFDAPGEKEKRTKMKSRRREKGVASWKPGEIREIVEAAKLVDLHFHAQVLLLVNGGMGSTDLALLEDADIDWDRQCIHTERSKTLVPRVVPLWDSTAAAMRKSRASRPKPTDPQWATRFFLTMHGRPLVIQDLKPNKKGKLTSRRTDAVRNRFHALFCELKVKRKTNRPPRGRKPTLYHLRRFGAGPYTLRSAFATLSLGQSAELVAVIMGQKFANEVIEFYLRGDVLEKLREVVEHVRVQIWPPDQS